MVITPILFIAINFTIVQLVCSCLFRVLLMIYVIDVCLGLFLIGLGWQSMMECDEGLAYSAREHDCVPIELSDCNLTEQQR
jgi:hypothetical protein